MIDDKTMAQQITGKDEKVLIYDFTARKLRRAGKAMDTSIASKNITLLKDVFDHHRIPFWLIFGTCLGAVRDKGFIPHDTDTDIATFIENKEKVINAVPDLIGVGLVPIRTTPEDDGITFMKEDEYIDLSLFWPSVDEKGKACWQYQRVKESLDHFSEFRETPFIGSMYRVPQNAEDYLLKRYGPGWKKPVVGMHTPYVPLYKKTIRKLLKIIYKNSKTV